jgi:hypothetical protein
MSKDLFMEMQEEQLAKKETAISIEMADATFKSLGWENAWDRTPQELIDCKKLNHTRRRYAHDRRGFENTVQCDICKYYYKYDSSD